MNYLFSGFDRSYIITPSHKLPGPKQIPYHKSNSSLDFKNAEIRHTCVLRGSPTTMAQQRLYTKSIEDQWEVFDDDEFMRSNLRTCLLPLGKPNLCGACRMMDITSPEISFARDTLVRNYNRETCALCGLIYSVLRVRKIWDSENIVFTRTVDSFVLRGTEQKLLRLCRTGDGKLRTMFTPSQADPRFRCDRGCERYSFWCADFGDA